MEAHKNILLDLFIPADKTLTPLLGITQDPGKQFDTIPEQIDDALRQIVGKGTFGWASYMATDKGQKIARPGWNGKGMFVYYVPGGDFPTLTGIAKESFGDTVTYNPYFAIKNVDGTVSTWVPSVNDLLAKDWVVLD